MSNEKDTQVSTAVGTEVPPQTVPVPLLFADVEADAGSSRTPLENGNTSGNECPPTIQVRKGSKPGFGERPAFIQRAHPPIM